jgi:hypothetical protein
LSLYANINAYQRKGAAAAQQKASEEAELRREALESLNGVT